MTVELLHDKAKDKSLVLRIREDEVVIEYGYVVCSHYNSQAPEGQRWDWGHYFRSLLCALDYYNGIINNEEDDD